MEIAESETYGTDWDWFGADKHGNLGHFATAGGHVLPVSFRLAIEKLDFLCGYFRIIPLQTEPPLEPGLADQRGFNEKPLDFSSFLDMAARGLYSYDSDMTVGLSRGYYLVARPLMPLRLEDLPLDIQQALAGAKLDVSFPEDRHILEEDTRV